MKRYIIAYSWIYGNNLEVVECEANDDTSALQWLIDYLFNEFVDIKNFGQLFEYIIDKNYLISYPYEIVDKS